jgi:hypothetical protein
MDKIESVVLIQNTEFLVRKNQIYRMVVESIEHQFFIHGEALSDHAAIML